MKTSPDGIAVMHYFESCELEAYPDPGSSDGHPWTIGWGDTGPDVYRGLVITQADADARFENRLSREFEPGVTKAAVTPEQDQFDAMVCLAYNIGVTAFTKSTLLRKFNAGDTPGADAQFPAWNKNDGKVMLGLRRRRAAEQALFRGASGAEAIAIGKAVK